jgi:hypothetical protein
MVETDVSAVTAADGVPRRLLAELWADPRHAAETFALHAVRRLGPRAIADAAGLRGESSRGADRLVAERAVRLTSIHGAIAGTPLFLALVPAYMAMLWEQARMVLRIAALHERDATSTRAAAEILVLRGVHPTVERAEVELHQHLAGERSRLPRRRALIDLVRALLVLAGFLEAKELTEPRGRLKAAAMMVLGVVLWAITWVVPFTFILLMSWSCRSSTRTLASRAMSHYGGGTHEQLVTSNRRSAAAQVAASLLTCALPATVLFIAAKWHPDGIGLGRALAALAGLALVLVLLTRGSRLTGRREPA